jgi:hypothetical protein
MMELTWPSMAKLLGGMLMRAATDPPDEYKGERFTMKGNMYRIYKIPEVVDRLPWQFCFTLDLPGYDGVMMLVRETKFDSAVGMERLLGHEERHVDKWTQLGWDGFAKEFITNDGRMDIESHAHAADVNWRMLRDESDPPVGGMDRLGYWTMYYAAEVDQVYHIRGHGIEDAYRCIARYLASDYDLAAPPWEEVAEFLEHFKNRED